MSDREFDVPGMATARKELWKLGGTPSRSKRAMSRLLLSAVRELYPEIRAAREQGHGWKKIADIIKSNTAIPLTPPSVQKHFEQIDAEWERETGVPALVPEEGAPPKRRGRPPKKKPKSALEKLEARIEGKGEI